MTNRYLDLIDQTYFFPQDGFDLLKGHLSFHGIPIMKLIKKYGTPLKITYLPKIGDQIKRARNLFHRAIKRHGYAGKYYYSYCTKCCHFSYALEEVLNYDVQLETSSAFDIDLIEKLYRAGKCSKDKIVISNGFKSERYVRRIVELTNQGFRNVIPVIDNAAELEQFKAMHDEPFKIGLRLATNEEPHFDFYTSRLGFSEEALMEIIKEKIIDQDEVELKMLHFFVDTGIKDSMYYWGEFKRCIRIYCKVKKLVPSLKALNIGGGLPIRNSLGFEYDYNYMISEIVKQIQLACEEEGVETPDIFTEFGKYTIGESGATIFGVLQQKQQNDSELWYMIDNSIMNTLPDSWGMNERFILLPINKWYNEFTRVNIGGMSCDNSDYYNFEAHANLVHLPKVEPGEKEPLYIGFFHTGAYQDSLSGYGGIKHCLIPSPKHVLIDIDENGKWFDTLFRDEQSADDMLRILGYLN
ncbi:MAG: arginine decarboxylase [Saprospiraceae bacterium]|nr:arginine decarboxylase [Saprospiraceae bacterium]